MSASGAAYAAMEVKVALIVCAEPPFSQESGMDTVDCKIHVSIELGSQANGPFGGGGIVR